MGKEDNKTSFYMIFEAIKLFVSYTSGRVNVGDEVTWGYQHDHTDNHGRNIQHQNEPPVKFYGDRIHIIGLGIKFDQSCVFL